MNVSKRKAKIRQPRRYLFSEMVHGTLLGRKCWCGVIFISPWLVGAAVFFLYPLIMSLMLSFSDITSVSDFTLQWTGLKHYRSALFDDIEFIPTFLDVAADNLINLPLINIFALIIAIMLNKDLKCRGMFRALFFLPVMLGTGFIMQQLLGQNVDEEAMSFARGLLLPEQAKVYLGPSGTQLVQNFLNRMTMVLWRSGVQIIIYLSGLQGISRSIYEAARVDSASEWESFWLITLPMMAPMIQLNLVYTVVDTFTMADNPIVEMIKKLAFESGEKALEYSSAISWMYCVFLLLVVGLLFLLTRRFVNNLKEGG